mgnify:CR=1 FL=1
MRFPPPFSSSSCLPRERVSKKLTPSFSSSSLHLSLPSTHKKQQPDNFLFLYADEHFDSGDASPPSSSALPPSPVRATDFGLAIRHSPSDPPLTSRTGTPVYMAPEVILQNYGAPADCWVRKGGEREGFLFLPLVSSSSRGARSLFSRSLSTHLFSLPFLSPLIFSTASRNHLHISPPAWSSSSS